MFFPKDKYNIGKRWIRRFRIQNNITIPDTDNQNSSHLDPKITWLLVVLCYIAQYMGAYYICEEFYIPYQWDIFGTVLMISVPVLSFIISRKFKDEKWSRDLNIVGRLLLLPSLLNIVGIWGFNWSFEDSNDKSVASLEYLKEFARYGSMACSAIGLYIIPLIYYFLTSRLSKLMDFHGNLKPVGSAMMSLYFIMFCCCSFGFPNLLNAKRSQYENRCKLTLRALGATELDFADRNNGNFGTWEQLVNGNYMIGTNRKNVIEYYSIAVFSVDKSKNSAKIDTFTIVALPINPKFRLRTFALGEDQIERVWINFDSTIDFSNIDLKDLDNWEPLR